MKLTKDALIVLSCKIEQDGQLTADARSSVELAVRLWQKKSFLWLVMSGSVSYKADFVPPCSEAQAMKDYAVELGLSAEKILVEAESKDTLGNAYFTKVNSLAPLKLHTLSVVLGPNHTHERVDYIFGQVLGRDYTYDVVERVERAEEAERERKSLSILKSWFAEVEAGDDQAIYRIMQERHPAYSSDPEAGKRLEADLANA